MSNKALVQDNDLAVTLIQQSIKKVRPEIMDNPYLSEAINVLSVKGYRSAIGSFWNAVVDDLRNKIIHRSLSLFNKAKPQRREIKTYEDFQNLVNDDDLIEGAYEIGVIGWEAAKILKHAKETRHIFDGHPRSSNPSPIKVLAMFDDCMKYVLNEPYPIPVVDIDDYIATMGTLDFDRNEVAIKNAITELPAVYKKELINRLFTTYIHESTPTDLRSNIELVSPILWKEIDKDLKHQVVRRVDQELSKANAARTREAFRFVRVVKASAYLSPIAKEYVLRPLVTKLAESLDKFADEDRFVEKIEPYAAVIPISLLPEYVSAITKTFVGRSGGSANFNRTDFYANQASLKIPKMVQKFDDTASAAFVECIREDATLRSRIKNEVKLDRLRILGKIVLERVSATFPDRKLLESLVDPEQIKEFWKLVR